MKIKKVSSFLIGIGLFVVCYLLLLVLLPQKDSGMDATFVGWYYLRTMFLSIILSVVFIVFVYLISHRKKLLSSVPDFLRYQPLLFILIRRDFTLRYRRSVLGFLWTILNPLCTMLIMTMAFSNLFAGKVEYFAAYVFSGNIVFATFSEATNSGMSSLISGAGMLKKVYIPKYIFPLSKTIAPFINVLFSTVALVLVMLIIGAPFHVQMLMIPVAVLYLLIFCLGMSLLLSTVLVFFRDMQHLYGIILTALMYMSAIFYDINIIPVQYMPFFALNPLLHYVSFFRDVALNGVFPPLGDHLTCLGIAVVVLCIGVVTFHRKQNQFILHI